jgi:hypothetical protein
MTIQNRISQETANATTITKAELVEKMLTLRNGSHTFGGIVLATEPKMNKGGNPFHNRVTKLAKWSFGINTEYLTKLMKEMERQGLDTSALTEPTSNYVRYNDKKNCSVLRLKSNLSKLYLNLFPNKDKISFVEYYLDGVLATELETAQIKSWIGEDKPSAKQTELGISEERQIKIRTPKLESVVAITLEGVTYKVV